jgi:hypothetical protein
MRGTALSVLIFAVPTLLIAMRAAARGSLRAQFVWLGALAYIAYNAVMFCFAASYNCFFLLYTTLLTLSFWSLLTLLRAFDLAAVSRCCVHVPARAVAIYLLVCLLLFAGLWLSAILPSLGDNSVPTALTEAGMKQNPVWVLDFAFTFPLMSVGARWLWQKQAWGYVVSGMMTIMLTIETAGIGVDQYFGHLHDPAAPLSTVPVMGVFTIAGLIFSWLFLKSVRESEAAQN